jgi:hypothetical protein
MMIDVLLAAVAIASSYPPPIEPAGEGEVMCFRPNEARKTCAATGTYSDNGDGTFTNSATFLLPEQPVMVMKMKTILTVKDGVVCGTIHADGISSAVLSIDDKELSPDEARPTLDRLAASVFSPIVDKEICTTYVPTNGQLISKATFKGKPFGVDAVVKWVRPDEGYTVTP